MSVWNSGWPRQQDSSISREPDPSVNSDSDPGRWPVEDNKDTSVQAPADLIMSLPHLDASQAANWLRLRTLLQQLPPQDSDERYCLALGEEELAELRLFCAQRQQKSLGQGVARLLPPKLEGQTCEKLIFSQRCTEAEGQRWHENHFCCQDCAGPLGGGRYALPGGSPCCPNCLENRYGNAGSSLAGALEGRASLGEGGPDQTEGWDGATSDAEAISGAALPAAVPSSNQETSSEPPKGRGQGRLEAPGHPEGDGLCPTCSSSSESEPEGFFLGQRLPGPWKTPENLHADDSDASRKHCTIC